MAFADMFAALCSWWNATKGDPEPLPHAGARNLVALYGPYVFPTELTDILNCDLMGWEHRCVRGANRASICGRLYQTLYRTVLKLEENNSDPLLFCSRNASLHLSA